MKARFQIVSSIPSLWLVVLAGCGQLVEPSAASKRPGLPNRTITPTVPQPGPNNTGYTLGFTDYDCVTDISVDVNNNHFNDVCEDALAKAFEPRLRFHTGEWDKTREPAYAVARVNGSVRIMYLLAYHRDEGSIVGLTPFLQTPFTVGAHNGDSEFIVVFVGENNGVWAVGSAFLSAHYGASFFGISFEESEWPSAANLIFPNVNLGQPRIYVSKDKHANYRSQGACNAASPTQDSCDGGWSDEGALAGFYRNISSLNGGCTASAYPGIFPGTECFWDWGGSFKGWTGSGDATPYGTWLRKFEFGGLSASATPHPSISGPRQVHSNCPVVLAASVQGGTPPFSYKWYHNTVLMGTLSTFGAGGELVAGSSAFEVSLRVRDAYGFESETIDVFTIDNNQPCQP